MLENECIRIGKYLEQIDTADLSPVILLGSNSKLNGPKGQNFISKYIIDPGESRGVQFIHSDLSPAPGVDISGDLFCDDVLEKLRDVIPKTIICANILEHVLSPGLLVERISKILPSTGIAIYSVPKSFPYHPAPIDTYFRPSPRELSTLCKGSEIMVEEVVDCGSFFSQIEKKPSLIVRYVLHGLLFFIDVRRALSSMHRILWLFRGYRVSLVIAKKI